MSEATDATTIVGNAEIVGFGKNRWGNAVVMVKRDAGGSFTTDRWGNRIAIIQNEKTQILDRRAVNTRTPQIGQRGWLEYREYLHGNGHGFRWFFDVNARRQACLF